MQNFRNHTLAYWLGRSMRYERNHHYSLRTRVLCYLVGGRRLWSASK